MTPSRLALRITVPALLGAALVAVGTTSASATIHPIIQAISCASEHADEDLGDPPGQTPAGFENATETVVVTFPTITITFDPPLTFDTSDFRALMATGVITDVNRNAAGQVVSLQGDLTVPALNGQGGAHCAHGR